MDARHWRSGNGNLNIDVCMKCRILHACTVTTNRKPRKSIFHIIVSIDYFKNLQKSQICEKFSSHFYHQPRNGFWNFNKNLDFFKKIEFWKQHWQENQIFPSAFSAHRVDCDLFYIFNYSQIFDFDENLRYTGWWTCDKLTYGVSGWRERWAPHNSDSRAVDKLCNMDSFNTHFLIIADIKMASRTESGRCSACTR